MTRAIYTAGISSETRALIKEEYEFTKREFILTDYETIDFLLRRPHYIQASREFIYAYGLGRLLKKEGYFTTKDVSELTGKELVERMERELKIKPTERVTNKFRKFTKYYMSH